MRVVHLSTDLAGGAGRAALRLHEGLRRAGCDSTVLFCRGRGGAPGVLPFVPPGGALARLRRLARRGAIAWSLRRYRGARPDRPGTFADDRTQYGAELPRRMPLADLVHLHWVAGFVDYRAFLPAVARRCPIVWTLHDMNPFTGGCHLDDGCGRHAFGCGRCPQLGSADPGGPSRRAWLRSCLMMGSISSDRLAVWLNTTTAVL